MLFNSLEFLLLFVPLCVCSFYFFARYSQKAALVNLIVFSLIFYSVWNPYYLSLLLVSIGVNYIFGGLLQKHQSKILLTLAVSVNLLSIAYFKYIDFLIGTSNALFETDFMLQYVILPLGISFFTFQQISYVIECYRGEIKSRDFKSYALFVSFFPQLIAGPIVRFQEVSHQFLGERFAKLEWKNILSGLIIFSIGLSKKVFLADDIAAHASPIFAKADAGGTLNFIEAWFGSIAYSFQIYFDFSAYSDMAIGLGLMLGIALPVNFLSPYKATNIIDFWRTWHITLSRFLRDYLYFPLGGNKHGKVRRHVNLMLVMLLGGLWHGASWNFVIWGGLHGLYLMINHAIRRLSANHANLIACNKPLSIAITFILVTFAWVFFRAETLDGALHMASVMATLPDWGQISDKIILLPKLGFILFPCAVVVWMMPNSIQILQTIQTRIEKPESYRLNMPTILAAIGFAMCVYFIFAGVYSEFIYFQF